MKHNELSLDQLQQIKGGSKFWGTECQPNVDSWDGGQPRETIDGIPNHIVDTCTYTCDTYIFGFLVKHDDSVPGGCTLAHFGL